MGRQYNNLRVFLEIISVSNSNQNESHLVNSKQDHMSILQQDVLAY